LEGELNKAKENWRDVVGFEGHYMVSDLGGVRNVRTGRILSLAEGSGALVVSLPCKRFISGHRATRVHSLVLEAFVGPRPHGMVGRHLDGNFRNNALSNLAYGTPKDNMDDRERHGNTARGVDKSNAAFTDEDIAFIRAYPRHDRYQEELAKRFNVTQSTISKIITRRSWFHLN
jgi:hypothetical protein